MTKEKLNEMLNWINAEVKYGENEVKTIPITVTVRSTGQFQESYNLTLTL